LRGERNSSGDQCTQDASHGPKIAGAAEGAVDGIFAVADDVLIAVSIEIGDEARMSIDPPALIVAEICKNELSGGEAASRRVSDPHARITKAHDVRFAIAIHIDQYSRMPVDSPASCQIAEVSENELGGAEACARGERDVYSVITKGHDVLPAIAIHVGSRADMLRRRPTLVVAEICKHEGRRGEVAVRRGQGKPHARVAEGDNVFSSVAIHIR